MIAVQDALHTNDVVSAVEDTGIRGDRCDYDGRRLRRRVMVSGCVSFVVTNELVSFCDLLCSESHCAEI